MRAVRIHSFGGPEVLKVEDVPIPRPKEDEVLVKLHAASVNPVDYKIRSGQYPRVKQDQLPIVLGRDGSGTVEACGKGVRSFKEGDAIYAMVGSDRGTYTQYVRIKTAEGAPKPQRLDHVQAAAVPLAALTAWQGLFDHGCLRPAQRVLIHGGAGGVGHFAIQFAKARGAFVATTVSKDDIEFARGLGADQVIDYKNERFEEVVSDIDLVLDLIAGATQDRSWSVVKDGGIIVSTLAKPSEEKAREHRARGANYMAQPNAAQLAEIGRLIDQGKVRPVVAGTLPLDQAARAHERIEHEHLRGKIVLTIAADASSGSGDGVHQSMASVPSR